MCAGVNLGSTIFEQAEPLQFNDHCLTGNVRTQPLHGLYHCIHHAEQQCIHTDETTVREFIANVGFVQINFVLSRILAICLSPHLSFFLTDVTQTLSLSLAVAIVSSDIRLWQVDNAWMYNANYLLGAN